MDIPNLVISGAQLWLWAQKLLFARYSQSGKSRVKGEELKQLGSMRIQFTKVQCKIRKNVCTPDALVKHSGLHSVHLCFRAYLGRVLIVQQQQMQTLQILSLWTLACPVRTAAPARGTLCARSALLMIHLSSALSSKHLQALVVWYIFKLPHSLCFCVDLRGVRRWFDGMWRWLQQAVSHGVSRFVVPTWRKI